MMDEDAVTGVTSNPTIFQKALSSGDAYDEDLKKLLAETDDPDRDLLLARAAGHPRRLRRAEAGVRRVERRRRLRLDGGRARRSRTTRSARSSRRAGSRRRSTGRTCSSRSRRRCRACRRSRTACEGHVDQHHADLLARPLQGGRRGVPARARAARRRRRRPVEGRVGRVVLRLARRHRGRQAPRRGRPSRAAGQARDREREARLRALPRGVRQRRAGRTSRARARRSSAACGRPPRRRTRSTAT